MESDHVLQKKMETYDFLNLPEIKEHIEKVIVKELADKIDDIIFRSVTRKENFGDGQKHPD